MLARLLVLILLSMLLSGRVVSAAEPAGIAGTWEGRVVLGDSGLRLVFNLTADAKGSLSGKMDSPDQGKIEQTIDPQALQVLGEWVATQTASTGR